MPPKKKKAPVAPKVGSDQGEIQQQSYIRSALQSNVVALKERCKTLAEDNEALRKTRSKVERDTHEFVAYFQTEMEKKDEIIATLKDRVAGLEYDLRKQTREITERLETEIRLREEAAAEVEADLKRKLAASEDDVYALRNYRDNKERVEAQVSSLKEQLERQEEEFKTQMSTMERKFLEDKSRILKDHSDQFLETKRRARNEAQKQLDSDTKRILLDNRRMGEELRFQQQEMEILQTEQQQLEDQNKKLARELELFIEKEKEYARLGSRRSRENKDLTAKVKALEGTITKMARDGDRARDELVAKTGGETEDMRLEVHALRQLIKLKNKELRTLKRLSETILSQRTEVETFFLEALEQVKSELRQRREMTKKTASSLKGVMGASAGRSLKFPSIKDSGSPTAAGGTLAGGKVDLKDLGLEDRERVLRLMFAKINSVSSAQYRPGTAASDPGHLDPHTLAGLGGEYGGTMEEEGDFDVGLGGPFGLSAPIPES